MKKIILILLLIFSTSAYSMIRGNDIYPACEHLFDTTSLEDLQKNKIMKTSMKSGFNIGFCMGVIQTAFQGVRGVGYVWLRDTNFSRCMEDYYGFPDINGRQILDMTMSYLKQNPQYRNVEINIIMAKMLNEYYPPSVCIKDKKTE